MKQKDFLLIAIFTFITVSAWIILSIYHARVTSTISPALKEKIEPIEPRFNTAVIETLKKQRKTVNILPEITAPISTQTASPGGLPL